RLGSEGALLEVAVAGSDLDADLGVELGAERVRHQLRARARLRLPEGGGEQNAEQHSDRVADCWTISTSTAGATGIRPDRALRSRGARRRRRAGGCYDRS